MSREKWEYMYLHVECYAHQMLLRSVNGGVPNHWFQGKNVIEFLRVLGEDGWELVCSSGADNDMLVLKRPAC